MAQITLAGGGVLSAKNVSDLNSNFSDLYAGGAGFQDNITALAGGAKSGATLITAEIARVATVTSVGDSVLLPVSAAGMRVYLINNSANAMTVYGNGTDTINGVATATGISQPGNSVDVYVCGPTGSWFVEGGVGFTAGLPTDAFNEAVAAAGANQSAATQLTGIINRVTSGTGGVALPTAVAGLDVIVINHTSAAIQVYGNNTAGDTIDDVATGTGVSQMQSSFVLYACTLAGKWYSEGLASGFSLTTGLATTSFTPTVSAGAAGQSTATPLTAMINRVSTVTSGQGVALPAATVGEIVVVDNRGANPLQVYGNNAAADTINGVATGTGISQGVNTIQTYYCFVAGNWETGFAGSQPVALTTLSVNGAIPPHTPHTYVITKGSQLVDTLAAPTATTDDGIVIQVTSNTAFGHTITATGLLQTGTASVNVATFAAQAGAGLTLMAYQGKWNVMASVGITFS